MEEKILPTYRIFLTEKEYKILCEKVGKKSVDKIIERADAIINVNTLFELTGIIPMLLRIIIKAFEEGLKQSAITDENKVLANLYQTVDSLFLSYLYSGELIKKTLKENKEKMAGATKNIIFN